ncbi:MULTISPECIES: preprotein translocase subunit YajC [Acinetobacter]|uniref:Preprotein translocase subunit YajC n=2 Tax=Acinetobacter TaxID=469 RepID=A0ABT7WMC5_9GAMM|nr:MULTISPECIES: preprotein translocase subunit YajC [Acinetobacter]MCY6411719.1 preprotein translocase subunit YajC [Acinetobacter thutiue]MDH0030860.1 preprotein translocase subunit YajC [Acinetobacter sp. GD04021]MDH0886367.1 preprotein translocase subunit YajC [Acinetobacter sp. GD03873]MDH1082883.1 preprotein translocase subunit YajC [Acinetobacter sp. GD03983]MDH2189909.1 preprotein translocase subunit YajC [Acinetobacter sp. GD03645]
MFHLSHNYQFGVIVLILAFLVFYIPMVYAFFKIRKQQQKQDQ